MSGKDKTTGEHPAKFTGVIALYLFNRGMGFITPDEELTGKDIFFHHSQLPASLKSKGIKQGTRVSFEMGTSEHNKKGDLAVNLEVIE